MAKYNNIIKTLKNRFGCWKGNAFISGDVDGFRDYMIVCLDNDGDFWRTINGCRDTSIKGHTFNACAYQIADLARWYEFTPKLEPIDNRQFKKALTEFFGMDYTEVLKPIVNYFIEEKHRDENEESEV